MRGRHPARHLTARRSIARAPPAAAGASARSRPARGRASSRCRGARAGRSSSRSATLRPIPITAHPSCGRPSTRMPATLRPSSHTSFGHLTAVRSGPPMTASTVSATATPVASGSSRGGSRMTTEQSSARPAGATHTRPCRPRPAVCSAAVTTVPWGAPAAASSRARTFVESIRRKCRRGDPSLTPT